MHIKNGLILREICGEQVILGTGYDCIDFNKMLVVNNSTAYLWPMLEKGIFDTTTLAEYLCEQYDTTLDIALADVENLLTELEKAGCIEP